VATWAKLAKEAPDLAASGWRLLGADGVGIAYLATVARDGRPRLAPVCAIFAGEQVYLRVGAPTPKRSDLERDGRYALHAPVGESDEEFQISGRAALVTDPEERRAVHAAIRFSFQEADPVFSLGIERCLWGIWENAGQPNMRPIRKRWRARE
jgi:hypothetical protein